MEQAVKEGAETLLQHAERAPVVVIAMVLLGAIVAFIGWFCLRAWPQHIQTQKDNRAHLEGLLKQRGQEAAEDINAARELARVQHEAIVSRVEAKTDGITGRIEKLSERIDRNAESVSQLKETVVRIAVKVGVASLAILLCGATCSPSLKDHERLGALGSEALRQCRAQVSRCAALVPCATAARAASQAMQEARVQVSGGTTPSTETTVRATSLPALAESTCKAAGVVVR